MTTDPTIHALVGLMNAMRYDQIAAAVALYFKQDAFTHIEASQAAENFFTLADKGRSIDRQTVGELEAIEGTAAWLEGWVGDINSDAVEASASYYDRPERDED